jgi:Kef-type K+ transport system membrane component KefB
MQTSSAVKRLKRLFQWGSWSLIGHIAIFETVCALPMFALFIWLNYSDGDLTYRWGLWIAFVCMLLGLFLAVPMWHVITLPRIKRLHGKRLSSYDSAKE